MKERKWIIVTVLVLLILTAIGFGIKRWITVTLPQQFEITRVQITVDPDSIFLRIRAAVPTNNIASALFDSMRYTVSFDTAEFASGIKQFGHEAADTLIELPLGMDRHKLFSTIRKLQVQDSTSLNIRLEPYLRTPGKGNKRIPFTVDKRIRVPIPPEVMLDDIDLDKLRLKEISLKATLQVVNLNPIEFIIQDGTLNLDFPGLFDGIISVTEPVHLKKMDTTLIETAVQLGGMKVARTAWNLVFKKDEVEYHLYGKLYVTPVHEPGDTIEVIIKSRKNRFS